MYTIVYDAPMTKILLILDILNIIAAELKKEVGDKFIINIVRNWAEIFLLFRQSAEKKKKN